jgi:hypothetical protein
MIAQRHQPEADRGASFPALVVPDEIVIMQDRLIEQPALIGRYDDDRRTLDQRTRTDRSARKDAATLCRVVADFQNAIGNRPYPIGPARMKPRRRGHPKSFSSRWATPLVAPGQTC